MNLWKILAELQQERTRIEEAIVALERLTLGQGKRLGGPLASMAALKERPRKRQGIPPGTRKAKSEAREIRSRSNRKNFVTHFGRGISEIYRCGGKRG